MKEIKTDTNKWKVTHIHGLNMVKVFTLAKGIYRFNAISINIPHICHRNRIKAILQLKIKKKIIVQPILYFKKL